MIALWLGVCAVHGAGLGSVLKQKPEWFRTDAGREALTNILSWQSATGAWPKNQDNSVKRADLTADRIEGTFDNGATLGELRVLASAWRTTRDPALLEAWRRGADLILRSQYPSGGWPQRFPPGKGYARHITFNDGTMVGILTWLGEQLRVPAGDGLVDEVRREAMARAFGSGVGCILKCQVRVGGKRTGWGAQHDEVDLALRPARKFEPACLATAESAGVLRFLMGLDKPSAEVREAVDAGVAWLRTVRVAGIRQEQGPDGKRVVDAPGAAGLWPRFCEAETGRGLFCGRDGVVKYRLADIERERRDGYAWYGDWGEGVIRQWEKWARD